MSETCRIGYRANDPGFASEKNIQTAGTRQ